MVAFSWIRLVIINVTVVKRLPVTRAGMFPLLSRSLTRKERTQVSMPMSVNSPVETPLLHQECFRSCPIEEPHFPLLATVQVRLLRP